LINFSWLFILAFCLISRTTPSQSSSEFSLDEHSSLEQTALLLETNAKEYNLHWNREAIQTSIQLYMQATDIWKRLRKPNKAASCFREIGKLKILLGEKREAGYFFHTALEGLKENEDIDEKSKVLSNLSNLALTDGELNDSQRYFEQALFLAKQTVNPSTRASALNSAGNFYYLRTELPKSADFYKQSIEFWIQAGDVKGEADSLFRLGYVYLDTNEYSSALDVLDSALSKWEKTNDLRGQALTLKAIGTVLNVTNEKQKALGFYQKAEQLIPKDIDYFEQAGLCNGFGSIYEYYGNLKFSTDYRERALEFFRKDNHRYGQLATLTSLFRLSSLSNNDEAALNYYRQAENLALQLNDNFYLALNEIQLGTFYFNRGALREAEFNYRSALRLLKTSNDMRYISLISAKLGEIYERKNNFSAARKLYTDSLQMNRKIRDNFAEADTVFNLSRLESLESNDEKALQLAERSVELTETLYADVDNSKLKQVYFSSVFDRYELYINLLMKRHRQFPQNGFDIRALQAAEKSRSRSMLETLSLSEVNFNKDANPETVRHEREIHNLLNVKADQITNALSQNADKAEIQKLNSEIGELEHQLEQIKVDLKQNSPIYSAIKNPPPFDIAEFQNHILDENTLLLEFSFGNEESYLWLIGKNEFSLRVLPGREQIESSVQKLRELLVLREAEPNESIEYYQSRLEKAEKEYWQEAHILSNQLFGQVSSKIPNKRLVIVPDGKLHYFPVSALPFPNSEDNSPILLNNEIVYEPSASTLLILAKSESQSVETQKDLLVLADPIFSKQDSRVSSESESAADSHPLASTLNSFRFANSLNALSRLFASGDEAHSIAEIVGTSQSTLALGSAANRELVLNSEISRYKIIHFATHGLLDEERPELSSLVLSRYDEKGNNQEGTIRLHDIYGLNLVADLVVLSACNTGIGKEVKGEGLMSLNNAFLQAGAKSVVSSLWKVDDYAAQELMKNFYRELTSGNVTTSEALRRAQIKMWQNPRYKSPFYWAAFKIEGNFQTAPQLSGGFSYWIYLLLIFPLLLLGIYVYYRKSKLLNNKIVING